MNSKLQKSRILGFIAMGFSFLSIPMYCLPIINLNAIFKGLGSLLSGLMGVDIPDMKFGIFDLLNLKNLADSSLGELFDMADIAEADLSDIKKFLTPYIILIIASVVLALAAGIMLIFKNKGVKITAAALDFCAFACTLAVVIKFNADINKVLGDAVSELGMDGFKVNAFQLIGIGIWLNLAFLFIAFVLALVAAILAPGAGAVDTGYGNEVVLPQAADASVTFLSGSCAGYQVPVDAYEELIIGKDPTLCAIVIDRKYEKVSRKHCGVRFDPANGMYLVTDYSTNGTRIVGGGKLMRNSTSYVERGTTINLANTENSFILN